MIGWVFFRSESLSHAIHYLGSMLGISQGDSLKHSYLFYFNPKICLTLITASLLATTIAYWTFHKLRQKMSHSQSIYLKPILYTGYYSLLVLID